MLQSLILSSSSSALIVDSLDLHGLRSLSSSSRGGINSRISCSSSSRNNGYIPKLEPFSRSRLERAIKDPPLIQRSENQLADYCSTLEGDESYNCWKAYFELKDLEKEAPKEEVERLIIESGGMKSLVGCLHGITEIHRVKKGCSKTGKASSSEEERVRLCPIPDGLPKSREELEEEENCKMPDSPFTRLLRTKGKNPAWYSPPADY